jgi:hypothetical protein
LTQARVVATFAVEKGRAAMMSSLFWAVLAGAALLGAATVVNLLFGRDLARTRSKVLGVGRLLERTRRLNDAVVEKGQESRAGLVMPTSTAPLENVTRRPLRLGE